MALAQRVRVRQRRRSGEVRLLPLQMLCPVRLRRLPLLLKRPFRVLWRLLRLFRRSTQIPLPRPPFLLRQPPLMRIL